MTDKLSVADDWIEWNGGECPVAPGTETEVKFRSGHTCCDNEPEDWMWANNSHHPNSDIIAYRLARERGL